ncbi:hypothetical protein, partial [Paenibacillus timonensis]|uniref:hypothetical protein n=1 Tax=Paenibacillus timonensis TaxID=225915 RepID=UPI0022E627FA
MLLLFIAPFSFIFAGISYNSPISARHQSHLNPGIYVLVRAPLIIPPFLDYVISNLRPGWKLLLPPLIT